MADQIQGLPAGAVVKPIGVAQTPAAQAPVAGLPPGAVVKPIQSSSGGSELSENDKVMLGSEPGMDTKPAYESPDPAARGVNEEVPEEDRGVMKGAARSIKGAVSLPANIYHAIADEPGDEKEAALDAMHGRLAVALNRLIIKPMVAEHERAKEYESLAAKEPDEKKKKQLLDMAGAHRIGGSVPLAGPASADMVDRGFHGDPWGAISELLTTLGMGKLVSKAGEGVKNMGPSEATVAGEKVPIPSNTTAARVARPVAKIMGSSGEKQLGEFADTQAAAGEKAATAQTKAAAGDAVKKITPIKGQPAPSDVVDFTKNFKEQAWALRDTAKTLANGAKRTALEDHAAVLDKISDAWEESMKPGVPRGTKPLPNTSGQPAAQTTATPDFDVLQRKLRAIGDADLRKALGGKQANVNTMHALIEQLRQGENGAKLGLIGSWLRTGARGTVIFGHARGVAGLEAGSYLLGKILTQPKAAAALGNGLKVGASVPVIGEAIQKAWKDEDVRKANRGDGEVSE